MDCGESNPVCLDLDHRDPDTKTRNPSFYYNGGLRWYRMSYDDLYAELEKCDVVCANCHRKRTAKRREVKT
jgi:hypothetical protein